MNDFIWGKESKSPLQFVLFSFQITAQSTVCIYLHSVMIQIYNAFSCCFHMLQKLIKKEAFVLLITRPLLFFVFLLVCLLCGTL